MSVVAINTNVVDEIVKEVKKLNQLEQQLVLTRLRVKRLATKKISPVANYDTTKIKPPTMAQIDKWKHEARKLAKDKLNAC
ncbi:MAG: hypothetical protein QM541_05735 [Flavobacterium sp.]|nr:hypothetical protein [Flavobacterium sp.]